MGDNWFWNGDFNNVPEDRKKPQIIDEDSPYTIALIMRIERLEYEVACWSTSELGP